MSNTVTTAVNTELMWDRQVQELRQQIQLLQQRVAELESRPEVHDFSHFRLSNICDHDNNYGLFLHGFYKLRYPYSML